MIYTPGHSLYTDTLMMYALARAAGDGLQRVVGQGISYALYIEDLTLKDLASSLQDIFDNVENEYGERLRRLVDEKDVSSARDVLARGEELARYLQALGEPGHARGEGRSGRGKSFKLPLMPSAGKYLRVDLSQAKKYEPSEYEVCSYCFAVALLGLAVGTVSMSAGTERVVCTLGFEGEAEGLSIRALLRSLSNLRVGQDEILKIVKVDEVPDRVLGGLILTRFDDSLILSLYGTGASWKSIVVRFDVARAVQIRGFTVMEADPILVGLEELIRLRDEAVREGVERPPACTGRLTDFIIGVLQDGAYGALEKLFDFFYTRDLKTLYAAVREAYSGARGRRAPGVELVYCLAHLSSEHGL